MNNNQIHFEKKFYLDKSTGYWISTSKKKIRAHVWVWKNCFGNIPKGCHIHHKDGNKSNNSPENLQIMDRTSHLRLHMMTDERRIKSKESADKYRHLTKEWHASEEGRLWHKLHALKYKFGKWDPCKYHCQCCAKEYESTKRNRTLFCSNACKSKFRRDAGIDDIDKRCPKCLKVFRSNKYSRTIYCSKACSHKT